ncbi:hypothetical protein Pmani_038130 [Petrolisthes manimaculis]|uniref:Uncharacterized protein n=1 Tax=Petrolisthes manimaculis TaxID=1843537 RepID=A0AAE1NHQ4_9EUCA|nr:hypothetical protein Pmani_038130 [Petrolisthes manimaculis]
MKRSDALRLQEGEEGRERTTDGHKTKKTWKRSMEGVTETETTRRTGKIAREGLEWWKYDWNGGTGGTGMVEVGLEWWKWKDWNGWTEEGNGEAGGKGQEEVERLHGEKGKGGGRK